MGLGLTPGWIANIVILDTARFLEALSRDTKPMLMLWGECDR